jgi:hypothetical protein
VRNGSKPRHSSPAETKTKKEGLMFDAHDFQHIAPNPAFARAALRNACEVDESQVAVMSGKLDRPLAPDASLSICEGTRSRFFERAALLEFQAATAVT